MAVIKQHLSRFTWPAIIALLIAGLASFALPQVAQADIAPPQIPGGSSITPGEDTGTQVEMAAEQVTITVGDVVDFSVDEMDLTGVEAQVEAVFQMQNTGSEDEEMQVRFPLVNPYGVGDGFFHVPTLTDFTVSVDGEPVSWIDVETTNPTVPDDPPVQWAAFDVAFPAGEPVEIAVTYNTHSTGYLPEAGFNYILETGAGWKGPIGAGNIVLRLPYVASPDNFLSATFPPDPQPQMEENEIRWHFENLEPKRQDNWSAKILSPVFMNLIYDLREKVADDPEDAGALKDLGDLYLEAAEGKGIYFLRPGAEHYILQAEQAYLESLVIRPEDPETNAMYLEALAAHYLNADQIPGTPAPSLDKIMNQLNVVYSLDPENERAQAIYDQLNGMVAEMPTPGAEPTLVSTVDLPTPTATATRRPVPTPYPLQLTPTSAPLTVTRPPFGISNTGWLFVVLALLCIGGLLLVIGTLVALLLRNRRR